MDTIGRYTHISDLAVGGMGKIYRGYDPVFDRAVAIKTVALEKFERAWRDDLVKRFFIEIRITGGLKHDNIVTAYDMVEHRGILYLIMEYVEGKTLNACLSQRPPLDLKSLSGIVEQLCEALDYIHQNGVIHRDLKPANIMIDSTDQVKLIDFGLARVLADEPAKMTACGIGTPGYRSPELLTGQHVDHRSDLFSLGVVLHEVLTGNSPHLPPPAEQNAKDSDCQADACVPALDYFFERALSLTPSSRYDSALELGEDLLEAVKRVGLPGKHYRFTSQPATITLPPKKPPSLLPLVVASLILVIALAAWIQAQLNPSVTLGGWLYLDDELVSFATIKLMVGNYQEQQLVARDGGRFDFEDVKGVDGSVTFNIRFEDYREIEHTYAYEPNHKILIESSDLIPIISYGDDHQPDDYLSSYRPKPLAGFILVKDVPSFSIGKCEVSNREYRLFVVAKNSDRPKFIMNDKFKHPDQPVVGISWHDAKKYCDWLTDTSDGTFFLPSKKQWEFAAYGSERMFPWGQTPALPNLANYENPDGKPATVENYRQGATPTGILNMGGNVAEWTNDWANNDESRKTILGGSWRTRSDYLKRGFPDMENPNNHRNDVGFRVCRTN